jgi:cytochrome c553
MNRKTDTTPRQRSHGRKDIVLTLLPLLMLAAPVSADLMQGAKLAPKHQEILAGGDPAGSAKKAKKCVKCHGETGVSDDDEIPNIAGQSASYVYKQLMDYKTGTREGGRMSKTARKLSEQDIANMAQFHAAQTLTPMPGVAKPASTPALVDKGDAGRGLTACADCHGADGLGKDADYDAPGLAGMSPVYFVETMQAFKSGERANDPDEVMRQSAKALSDAEIKALSAYYLALGQRKAISIE